MLDATVPGRFNRAVPNASQQPSPASWYSSTYLELLLDLRPVALLVYVLGHGGDRLESRRRLYRLETVGNGEVTNNRQ